MNPLEPSSPLVLVAARTGIFSRPFSIRPAIIDRDRTAMLQVLEHFNMHWVPSDEMAGFEVGTWFVAEVDGRVAGVCGFGYLHEEGELIGKTKLLAVDPEFARCGIGVALQRLRMGIMRDAGAARVRTCADRPETIEWYKSRFGYREVGRLPKIHEFGLPDVDCWTVLEAPLAVPRARVLDADPDGAQARNLAERLRRLYIGEEIARGILALAGDPEGASADFVRSRARWESRGGFIEAVSPEQVIEWIASPAHLVVEASSSAREFRAEAQAIFTIPEKDWVVPRLGGPNDQVASPELHERILNGGPAASAWIDFLSAAPQAAPGLAGQARYTGMLELIERHPGLRQVIGTSFRVQGIETAGGRRILLGDLGQAEILNLASVDAISRSRRCPAHMLGVWRKGSPVRVEVEGAVHRLLIDWTVFVRLLEEVQPAEVQAKATK